MNTDYTVRGLTLHAVRMICTAPESATASRKIEDISMCMTHITRLRRCKNVVVAHGPVLG